MSADANGQIRATPGLLPPLIVVVTGAAGRIAYSLIPLICNGSAFGIDRRIDLRLIDVEFSMVKLQGVLMEVHDSNYDLLESVSISSCSSGFKDADVAVLLGGHPRMPGMERKHLIEKNAEGMREQGLSLEKYASKDVKVLVVANPANTNMLVLLKTAKKIPQGNFTCLTRLDEERLRHFVANKINTDLSNLRGEVDDKSEGRAVTQIVKSRDVQNVFIFGNHSTTQVPYIEMGTVLVEGEVLKVKSFFTEQETDALIHSIQNRGGEVMKLQGLSSGLSAAGAIVRHLRELFCESLLTHTSQKRTFSAGILSDGKLYGVPEGIVFSFPCYLLHGKITVVPDLILDQQMKERIALSVAELQGERVEAETFLTALPSPKL